MSRLAPDPRAWALDERTVSMLRASTPRAYLARNDADERAGVSPYADEPRAQRSDPREHLVPCGDCGVPFWTTTAVYCDALCRARAGRKRRAA